MEKLRIFPSLKGREAQRQTAFPDTLCGVVVATGCNIIRRRVASIGGSVFNSPAGGMEVQPNEDGAVNRMPFWYEWLSIKPGCVWKWTPWFWVWGRGGTVREVRGARQCLVWRCHSGRSASLWWRVLVSELRSGFCLSTHPRRANKNRGFKILRMICGCEVKQAVCDGQNGIIISTVSTNTDESFSPLSCLPGQHLCVNKSYGDYVDAVGGNLVLMISVFLFKGLQVPLWVKKKSPTCRCDGAFSNSRLEKHKKRFVIKLKTMLSSSEADRFYPSCLAFYYWYFAFTAM